MRNLSGLALALLLLAGCNNGTLVVPGPDPDPDPDPIPVVPPVRQVVSCVRTPCMRNMPEFRTCDVPLAATVTLLAGSTLILGTTGEALRDADSITYTLTPAAAVTDQLPDDAGAVLFLDRDMVMGTQTRRADSETAARFRLAIPGIYTLTSDERGTGYSPIVKTYQITVEAAAAGALRPEATEVTGTPAFRVFNNFAGMLMPQHGLGISSGDGGDGLGELAVAFVKQQRLDEMNGETATEYALYIGDSESGLWSGPIVVSTRPEDRMISTANPPVLTEFSPAIMQSFGLATNGRELDLAWTALNGDVVYLPAHLVPATSGGIDVQLGSRQVLDTDNAYRMVPLQRSDGMAILSCSNSFPEQVGSLVTYVIDRASGAFTTTPSDILLSSGTTARIQTHDADLAPDGSLVIISREQSSSSDGTPDYNYSATTTAYAVVGNPRTIQSNVITSEAPYIRHSGLAQVYVGYTHDGTGRVRRLESGTVTATFDLPARAGFPVTHLNLGWDTSGGGSVLALGLYAAGSILDNDVVGDLALYTLPPDLASSTVFEMPETFDITCDNGPGNVAVGIDALHVVWQENGIDKKRNCRLIEARTR